jgi:hypothetical protein
MLAYSCIECIIIVSQQLAKHYNEYTHTVGLYYLLHCRERELRKVVEFDEAYGELLPFTDEWKSIGTLMGVPLDIIKKMGAERSDKLNHSDLSAVCLVEVLEWITDNGFLPTRKKFNDIKEKIEAKAKKTHY